MKQLFYFYCLAFIFLFSGCKEEKEIIISPEPEPLVLPTNFTKKLMVEMLTGEWCSGCPVGQEFIENFKASNPEKVFCSGIHQKMGFPDRYENQAANNAFGALLGLVKDNSTLGGAGMGFPVLVFDRTPGNNGRVINGANSLAERLQKAEQRLQEIAICGLKIESKIEGLELKVKVSYLFLEEINEPVDLTVHLVEHNLDGSEQVGATNDYLHQNVLRETISCSTGKVIDGTQSNQIMHYDFLPIDVSNYNLANLEIIAFITKRGNNFHQHEILNAQGVKAGENQDFD